jgi:hypothetical protein
LTHPAAGPLPPGSFSCAQPFPLWSLRFPSASGPIAGHRLLQGARLDFSQDALLFQEIPEVTSAMGSFVHNFGDIVFYVSSTNQVRPEVFFAAS